MCLFKIFLNYLNAFWIPKWQLSVLTLTFQDLNNRWKSMIRKSIAQLLLISIGQSMINRSHLSGRELYRLPSTGTKFMSPYLQVLRECTQIILFLNLGSKVWELFIDVALRKTAQIMKTINISLPVLNTNLIDLPSSSLQRFNWPGMQLSFKHEAYCYFFFFFFLEFLSGICALNWTYFRST